ncbi:MAG: hypothetical protein SPG17_08585 [Schaalia hyovaginalis]|uniref:hypothetical protein n=1 Tax=Schaalia hyovaginalis TaxID=29316 RepID=UPI0023F6C8B9|nr:hypothetical protein [Schaalia hyovaginalis]MCI7672590.1 hypothetical protein [Schaalia hyovaginalis]MDY5506886.1 hypothetical protein [Schaalia hyovaginalis]
MPLNEGAFARLLRFYPKRWREDKGEEFLTTLLEDARARGLERPDGALVRSAIVHGWGSRLTLGVALAAAALGCLLAIVHQWLYTGLLPGFDAGTLTGVREAHRGAYLLVETAMGRLVVPFVSLLAIAALMRVRGRLSPPRALGFVVGASASFACGWLAGAIRLILEETRGAQDRVLFEAVGVIGVWAVVFVMAVTVAFAVDEILEGAVAHRAVRWIIGLALGAPIGAITMILGEIVIGWFMIDAAALAAAIVVALVVRFPSGDSSPAANGQERRKPSISSRRFESLPMHVRILATLGAVLVLASWTDLLGFLPGLSSLVAGEGGAGGPWDQAFLFIGRIVLLLAPIVLFVAWASVDSALGRHSLASIWGPAVFLSAAWGLVWLLVMSGTSIGEALWRAAKTLPFFTDPKGFDIIATAMFIFGLPGVVWLVERYIPRRRAIRVLVALLVALAWYFAALLVFFGLASFFVPLGALILLVRAWSAKRLVSDEPKTGCAEARGNDRAFTGANP